MPLYSSLIIFSKQYFMDSIYQNFSVNKKKIRKYVSRFVERRFCIYLFKHFSDENFIILITSIRYSAREHENCFKNCKINIKTRKNFTFRHIIDMTEIQ